MSSTQPDVANGDTQRIGDYRLDLLVAESLVVELKAVEMLVPNHGAQLLTYLRLGGYQLGLLINFNVPVLLRGVRRVIDSRSWPAVPA